MFLCFSDIFINYKTYFNCALHCLKKETLIVQFKNIFIYAINVI